MSYKSFCKEFAKNNKLSSNDAKRLSESVQKLLKKNDQPTTSEIKNQVASILPSKTAKKFAKELFAEIDSTTDQSYYDDDYDYDEYRSKSKKGRKNRKREENSRKNEKKKRKYDDLFEEDDDDYDNSDIYYSYYESSYSDDVYSYYDDIPEKDDRRKFSYNRDRKNRIGERNKSSNRTSTEHLTASKTMFSRAYTSSEYQKLSRSIQQKKVPLAHRTYEKNGKNDKKIKSFYSNQKKDDDNDSDDNEKGSKPNEQNTQSNTTETVRQRFIIYVAGLSAQVNTVSKLYRHFHLFGRILGIQVNRQDLFALIEFNDLKSAYTAVNSKKPVFGNKLIKLGFASKVDSEMLEMLRQKEEEIEKQSKEMKSDLIFIDEDKQSDFSYDQSDDESYDMPDDV